MNKLMVRIGIKENRGFSLIELCIILAITAVTAAFAIPILTESVRGMQLASDAKKISTTMTYAKLSATSQMTSYQLSFDLDNNQWSLLRRNSSGVFVQQNAVNGLSDGVENSGIGFGKTSDSIPAPDVFATTSSATITFNSRGLPSTTGIVYLHNNDTDFAVSVSLAGKIQVWRYRDNAWVIT